MEADSKAEPWSGARSWTYVFHRQDVQREVRASAEHCQSLLRAATTPPIGSLGRNLARIANDEWLDELARQGIYFQGYVRHPYFDLWYITRGEAGSVGFWHPHFRGHLRDSSAGTTLEGTISCPTRIKALFIMLAVFSLGGISSIAVPVIPGVIIGVILAIVIVALLRSGRTDAEDEWRHLAEDVLAVVGGRDEGPEF